MPAPPAILRPLLPTGLASPYWRAPVGMGDDTVTQINSALETAGLPPNQIQSAIQAYTGLNAASTSCILGLLQGSITPSFTALAPLIAAGLAATGVGAPVAAIVAAALPVLDALADAIFASPQENCTWKVGQLCVQSKQPYGPGDPKWTKADTFFSTCVPTGWFIGQTAFGGPFAPWSSPYTLFGAFGQGSAPVAGVFTCTGGVNNNAAIDQAFPFYRSTIDVDLRYIQSVYGTGGSLKKLEGLWGFLYVYYMAWRANAEFAINGYKSADDYALLTSVAQSWNKIHAGTSTYTIQPVAPPSLRNCLNLYPSLQAHYPNLLLDGDVDGQDKAPVTINLGARTNTASTSASKASAPLSGGAIAGIAAAGVAGTALIGTGIYALATHKAYGAVWDGIVKGIVRPFR